jgi:hypothetical protein
MLLNENRKLLVEQADQEASYGEEKRFCDETSKNIHPTSKQQQVYQRQIALMANHTYRQSNVTVHQLIQALICVSFKCSFRVSSTRLSVEGVGGGGYRELSR